MLTIKMLNRLPILALTPQAVYILLLQVPVTVFQLLTSTMSLDVRYSRDISPQGRHFKCKFFSAGLSRRYELMGYLHDVESHGLLQ